MRKPTTLEIAEILPDPIKIPSMGDGATHCHGGDSYPGAVTSIENVRGTVIVTVNDDDCRFDREKGEHVFTPSMHRGYSCWRLDIIHVNDNYGNDGVPKAVWHRVYKDEYTEPWRKSGRHGGGCFGVRSYEQNPHF